MASKILPQDRFWAFVDKRGPDECWEWTGNKSNGYGYFALHNKRQRANRLAWIFCNGAIPKGEDYHGTLCVLHSCDNRSCVNPSHLFLGTQADNNNDCIEKNRINPTKGTRNAQAVLCDQDVRDIRKLSGKLLQKDIGELFGVNQQCISLIVNYQRWSHVI